MSALDWQWTNDERTEARADRWTIRTDGVPEGAHYIFHDDFTNETRDQITVIIHPGTPLKEQAMRQPIAPGVLAMYVDFLRWSAPAPPEPTTFGYVGYVTDDKGDVWDVTHDSYDNCDENNRLQWNWVRRGDGLPIAGNWPDVLALGTFTAVTR